MAAGREVQCVRAGPLGDEYPEPCGGQKAGRCVEKAGFEVWEDGDEGEPDPVCYRHLAQTVAAQSKRKLVSVRILTDYGRVDGTGGDLMAQAETDVPSAGGYVPPAYQVQPHMTPPETWTLTLNRYERDNLLNLIQRVMENDQRPAGWFNTGDWVGEIRWMLGKRYHPGVEKIMRVDEHDRPNPVRELPGAGAGDD